MRDQAGKGGREGGELLFDMTGLPVDRAFVPKLLDCVLIFAYTSANWRYWADKNSYSIQKPL